MISQYIGDLLIYLVSLPLLAFQTFEGLQAMVDVFNLIAEHSQLK
ncbi:hypothetical protein [Brevibacillus fulvus]|uniref:Uncharacterized protein n=1 Tax=Brevibacillus fulvus TaxID=1125967 RepID=A0A939BP17_9BACL|nr:hypothetical protein [Brevibacillus fulvus]MBM7589920.1 hypothetical protein [Brevibacillus fulvus]